MIAVLVTDPERFKLSKRAAGYRDVPHAGRCCKLCFRFRGNKCTAVEGFIFEDGYCRNFRISTVQQWINELHDAANPHAHSGCTNPPKRKLRSHPFPTKEERAALRVKYGRRR